MEERKKKYSRRHSSATDPVSFLKMSPKCNYVTSLSYVFFFWRFIHGLASALSPNPLNSESTALPRRLLIDGKTLTSFTAKVRFKFSVSIMEQVHVSFKPVQWLSTFFFYPDLILLRDYYNFVSLIPQ